MPDLWSPKACVDRVLGGLPLRRCLRGGGRCDPPAGVVTISDVPRLLVGIQGRCRMGYVEQGVVSDVPFAAGDALLIDGRRWNRPGPGDMSFLVIFFDEDHLRVLVWHQRSDRSRQRLELCRTVPAVLRHGLAAALLVDDEASRCALAEVLLRQVQGLLARSDGPPTAGWLLWRRVMAWFDQHLGEDIDRSIVARVFGVHRNHLTRVFGEQAGEGFTACLIRKRMERARHLLRETDLPVAEVGRLCGYPDPAAFSAAVKRFCGLSPRAVRQR